jgi:hypothetical protein
MPIITIVAKTGFLIEVLVIHMAHSIYRGVVHADDGMKLKALKQARHGRSYDAQAR